MKAMWLILAALVVLATPGWAQDGCLIHDWITVSNLTITAVGDTVIVSADLASLDKRNPVDFYGRAGDLETRWDMDGWISDPAGGGIAFDGMHSTNSITTMRRGQIVDLCPLMLTATKYEFRFPSSELAPGHHFEYRIVFSELATHYSDCYFAFTGTFDLPDPTPARRVSLGSLKLIYR